MSSAPPITCTHPTQRRRRSGYLFTASLHQLSRLALVALQHHTSSRAMTIIVLSWIKSPLPPSLLPSGSPHPRFHFHKGTWQQARGGVSSLHPTFARPFSPSLSPSLGSHVSNLLRSTPKMLFETNDRNGGENASARISYLVLQFPFRRCRM